MPHHHARGVVIGGVLGAIAAGIAIVGCTAGSAVATASAQQRSSVPGIACGSDADCGSGEICEDPGTTVSYCEARPCQVDTDCGSGRVCAYPGTSLSFCTQPCTQGSDCAHAGDLCVNGSFCQSPACYTDTDCGSGEFCVDGGQPSAGCVAPACADNTDCGIGEECQNAGTADACCTAVGTLCGSGGTPQLNPADCDGVVDRYGSCCALTQLDTCGVCGGPGPDASGNCVGDWSADCAGVPNGPAVTDPTGTCCQLYQLDACGVCNGDGSSCADCSGVPNGTAVTDVNGTCCQPSQLDACDVCNGPGPDADGTCGGSGTSSGSGA